MQFIDPTPKAVLEALNEHTREGKIYSDHTDYDDYREPAANHRDHTLLRSYWYRLYHPLDRANTVAAVSIIQAVHHMGKETFPQKIKSIGRTASRFSVLPGCRGELTVLLLQASSVGNINQSENLRALWELIKSKPFSIRECNLNNYTSLEYFAKNTPHAGLCSQNIPAVPDNIQSLLAASVLSSSGRDLLDPEKRPDRKDYERKFGTALFGQGLDAQCKKRMMDDLRFLNRHYPRVIEELAFEYAQYLVDEVEAGGTVTVDDDFAKFFLKGRRFEFAFVALFSRIHPKDYWLSYAEDQEGDAVYYPWDDSYPGKLASAVEMIGKLRRCVGASDTYGLPDWVVGAVTVSITQEDQWIEKWAINCVKKTKVTQENRTTFEHYFQFVATISNSLSTCSIELFKAFGFSASTQPRYLQPAACILHALRYRENFKHDDSDYRVIQAEAVIKHLYSSESLPQFIAENARQRAANGYLSTYPDAHLEHLHRFTGDPQILEHMPESSRIRTLEEDLGL